MSSQQTIQVVEENQLVDVKLTIIACDWERETELKSDRSGGAELQQLKEKNTALKRKWVKSKETIASLNDQLEEWKAKLDSVRYLTWVVVKVDV